MLNKILIYFKNVSQLHNGMQQAVICYREAAGLLQHR
jgi:hypothetical protein